MIADELYKLLEAITYDNCHCVARISYNICDDIIVHHERDLTRLIALHPGGLHPTKHIGYLAFWIRKLKPISAAFPIKECVEGDDPIPERTEICLINEMAALFVAQHLLLSYTKENYIFRLSDDIDTDKLISDMEHVLNNVIRSTVELEEKRLDTFQSMIYDMRYRTFGPHHVVHFIGHVLHSFMVKWEAEQQQKLELVYAG